MIKKLTRRAAVAMVPGLFLAAKGIRMARAQTKTVKIGVLQPMSGDLSPCAQEGQPIIEYLFNKINAEGGIKSIGGAKIELVVADESSQPARAAIEARRLATQENVSVIIGTLLRGQMLGISPIVDEYKVPTIALCGATVSAAEFGDRCRRPGTSLRARPAPSPSPPSRPGEADVIIGRTARAPSSPRICEQRIPLKRTGDGAAGDLTIVRPAAAAPPRRLEQVEPHRAAQPRARA